MRLLIGDANLLVRTGIRAIITEAIGVTEVGEATSGAEAIEKLRQHSWNLCILDISLPESGGLEVARYIRKGHRKTPVLFISSRSDRQYATAALNEGAKGFILRDCSREDLLTGVRTALDGGLYIGPELSEQLLARDCDNRPPVHTAFAARAADFPQARPWDRTHSHQQGSQHQPEVGEHLPLAHSGKDAM
jgi:DNA-binding NarL/FixJ family response regulator